MKKLKHFLWKHFCRDKKILNSKINKDGLIEDIIEVNIDSLPLWWNSKTHCLKEKKHDIYSITLSKYCTKCSKFISEKGCKHNL